MPLEQVSELYKVYQNNGPVKAVKTVIDFLRRRSHNHFSALPPIDAYCLGHAIRQLEALQNQEDVPEDALETAYSFSGHGFYQSIAPMQELAEISRLADFVNERQPETIVEIGTAFGGTLYLWTRYVTSADTIVSIDIDSTFPYRKRLFAHFAKRSRLSFINEPSEAISTVSRVNDLTNGQIDFLFIDGDHRYDGVKADFESYEPLVSDGGVIAFHDIIPTPNPDMEVSRFWSEIEPQYDTTHEFISPPDKSMGGIGLIEVQR
jgi:predicted O-methyltransferase YrrM